MTYKEILAHAESSVLGALDYEGCADPAYACGSEAETRMRIIEGYDNSGWAITGWGERDIEVPDPAGSYSGARGRYSMVRVIYPHTQEAQS